MIIVIGLGMIFWIRKFETTLTHFFPIHRLSTPWKHQKNFRFSDVFKRWRNGALGTNGLKALHFTFWWRACLRFYDDYWFNFNPSRPDPGRRETIESNFYFHTSLWCLKMWCLCGAFIKVFFWKLPKECILRSRNKITVTGCEIGNLCSN